MLSPSFIATITLSPPHHLDLDLYFDHCRYLRIAHFLHCTPLAVVDETLPTLVVTMTMPDLCSVAVDSAATSAGHQSGQAPSRSIVLPASFVRLRMPKRTSRSLLPPVHRQSHRRPSKESQRPLLAAPRHRASRRPNHHPRVPTLVTVRILRTVDGVS